MELLALRLLKTNKKNIMWIF